MLRPVSVLVAVVAALALAAAAAARGPVAQVVAFRSLAGVALGSSPVRVQRVLGHPSAVIRVRHRIAQLDFNRIDVVVSFDTTVAGDPATSIAGNEARYRTSKGIHVGSGQRAARRAYPTLRCNVAICSVYEGRPGAYHTRELTFVFARHRVASVQVSEVFDH